MPTYFFDVQNVPPAVDPVGEDLPNDAAAWRQATIVAGEVFKDVDGRFEAGQEWKLQVTDQDRSPIYEIQVVTKKLR